MQIQVNTDKNIHGGESLALHVKTVVEAKLKHFRDQVTRVEAHLSDENSHKSSTGPDKKCVLEARPAGLQPLAVSHVAANVEQAISGAADKLERLLESTFGQLNTIKGRVPTGRDNVAADE